jgi:hypothetical protein
MTGWIVALIVVASVIGLLVYVIGSRDRYEEMTEEEFEEEAKKNHCWAQRLRDWKGRCGSGKRPS